MKPFAYTFAAVALFAMQLVGCMDETNSGTPTAAVGGPALSGLDASLADTGSEGSTVAGTCRPILPLSALPIPARSVATLGAPVSSTKTIFVSDLFNLFQSLCGGCHVEVGLGGYQVGPTNFSTTIDDVWFNSMLDTDPAKVMPPLNDNGKLPADRQPNDPTNTLILLMKQWMDQGKPPDVFTVPAASVPSPDQYRVSESVAQAMTNIGACIPDKGIIGTERTKMLELDALLMQLAPSLTGTQAERIGLPVRLEDTDLFTFDTETLAHYGVIAYAPAYPVFTDGARDLRFVRVPVGQSIKFDPATQKFQIPPGTRFYRTVLKPVVEKDGTEHWRKMETRLAIVYPDDLTATTWPVTSVFGTYAWNDDESEATLVTDPLRDGSPFRDKITTFVSDEGLAEQTTAQVHAQGHGNLTQALETAHAIRRYVIPGYRRCGHCHVGSPSEAFVIGFTPLQVNRRPVGEGGVIDWVGDDELTQVDRFIDYGLLTGLASSRDIKPLEASEGTRAPRNDHELVAQGYMLGNCAHCHNPRGDATRQNPQLSDVLDMLPSATGGIFQFPLDRVSPRISRGLGGTVPMPYITPSLLDYPTTADTSFYTAKVIDVGSLHYILAPWRSLIYRGVDTPFTYSDDYALFPKMPMHTPGFDCRAPRVFGDWMVSIPGARANPSTAEYGMSSQKVPTKLDDTPQPYLAARTIDAQATAQAEARLQAYHDNTPPFSNPSLAPSRYNFCPDTSDIFDVSVLRDPINKPVPGDDDIVQGAGKSEVLLMGRDGVPDHAHWVVNDETEIPGDWAPRREDWDQILVKSPPTFPKITSTGAQALLDAEAQQAEAHVVDLLRGVTFSATMKAVASQPLPMGLWQKKASCQFDGVATVGSYGQDKPQWMVEAKADDNAPVYSELPGAAIHEMVCANCHGALADSAGRQATTLNEMTGGNALVSNLRNGLFGPQNSPGANVQRVFGPELAGLAVGRSSGAGGGDFFADGGAEAGALPTVTDDDLGARYFTWMGLGGTKKRIPESILAIVANTEFLGQARHWPTPAADANMLSVAQDLCNATLPLVVSLPGQEYAFDPSKGEVLDLTALMTTNGDGDLWRRVCSIDNPPPVRAVFRNWAQDDTSFWVRTTYDYYPANGYPTSARVGNDRGGIETGISSNNLAPWCVRKPSSANALAAATAFLNAPENLGSDGQPLPFCPTDVVPAADTYPGDDNRYTVDQLKDWGLRGALNAGFVTYYYLQQLAVEVSQGIQPQPRYDQCELLNVGADASP